MESAGAVANRLVVVKSEAVDASTNDEVTQATELSPLCRRLAADLCA